MGHLFLSRVETQATHSFSLVTLATRLSII
jgi:hypothetical protein